LHLYRYNWLIWVSVVWGPNLQQYHYHYFHRTIPNQNQTKLGQGQDYCDDTSVGGVSTHSLTASYRVWQAHYTCMKCIWYEFEVDEKSQSYPTATACPQWESHSESYNPTTGHREQITGWSCILMTCSCCSRCWIALYMYEEDLLWVWSEWGASIIRTNRDPPPTPRRSTLRSQRADIRVWWQPYDL
jgi:hypothetical protein